MNKYLYADLYELEDKHWWHIAKRKTCLALLRKYLIVKNPKILDVGCGTGKNVEEFSKLGQAYGLDNSPDALQFCKEKRGLKNISLGDAEKTGFDEKMFDVLSMLDVLEHTDDTKTLKEARRILKDSGYLLITVPAYQWMWSNWDVALHHKRRYTKGQIVGLLERNGFEIVKASYLYSFLLLPVYVVRKIKNVLGGENYSSDFKIGLPVADKVLGVIADVERLIAFTFGVPFGLSIIVIARKKLAAD